MGKMFFHFAAISKAVFSHEEGDPGSKPVECAVRLEVSPNLKRETYVQPDGLCTPEGIKASTIAFCMGLVTNVKYAAKLGTWDREEHIRFVKEQIERLLEAQHDEEIVIGTMEY